VDVEETALPGIGLRHDFQLRSGARLGVVSRRGGKREVIVYDPDDPDRVSLSLKLSAEESDVLAELLGAPRMVEKLTAVADAFAGLVGEQLPIPPGSPYAGRPLGDTRARTRTGASIVAVVRRGEVFASPRPDFLFAEGDVVVVVGTPENTAEVAALLREG
jgi:TrkA domain protein